MYSYMYILPSYNFQLEIHISIHIEGFENPTIFRILIYREAVC